MLSWLYRVFIGSCWGHKWKVIATHDIRWRQDGSKSLGTDYILKCEKCGDVIRKKCRSM